MKVESNADEMRHLTGGYYLNVATGEIYSRRGADMEGLRQIRKTRKLMALLSKHIVGTHGGKRKGAGRPKTMPETKVMRIPDQLVKKVEKLISEFYKKLKPNQ